VFSSRNSLVLSYGRMDLLKLYIRILKLVKKLVERLGLIKMQRCGLRSLYISLERMDDVRVELGLLRGLMYGGGVLGVGRRVWMGYLWVWVSIRRVMRLGAWMTWKLARCLLSDRNMNF
jgi:hypothetical protein